MTKKDKLALKIVSELQYCISILTIHGLMPDGEREKMKRKLDKWASKNGLRRKQEAKP